MPADHEQAKGPCLILALEQVSAAIASFAEFVNSRGGRIITATTKIHGDFILGPHEGHQKWDGQIFDIKFAVTREATYKEWLVCWSGRLVPPNTEVTSNPDNYRYWEEAFD